MSYLLLKRGILKIEMGHRLPSWLHSPSSPSFLKNNFRRLKSCSLALLQALHYSLIGTLLLCGVIKCHLLRKKFRHVKEKHQHIIHLTQLITQQAQFYQSDLCNVYIWWKSPNPASSHNLHISTSVLSHHNYTAIILIYKNFIIKIIRQLAERCHSTALWKANWIEFF